MLAAEAKWLGSAITSVPDTHLSPLLNVGSSTLDFRTRQQPYVDGDIFAPLRTRNAKVLHLDIKQQPGVDIVGDLTDPHFLTQLREMRPGSILVSNLFEHIPNRAQLAKIIADLVPSGGYVFASGPYAYPYHEDPVDYAFRPTVEEMAALFPGLELVRGEIIPCGPFTRGGRSVPKYLGRLLMPWREPRKWKELVRQFPYLFKETSAVAVVLRKP